MQRIGELDRPTVMDQEILLRDGDIEQHGRRLEHQRRGDEHVPPDQRPLRPLFHGNYPLASTTMPAAINTVPITIGRVTGSPSKETASAAVMRKLMPTKG